MTLLESVTQKITAQQKEFKETDAPYIVGEDLKRICAESDTSAELVLHDIDKTEMSLEALAKKLQEEADEIHKKTKANCVRIDGSKIIREFYGLPARGEGKKTDIIDLEDFFV